MVLMNIIRHIEDLFLSLFIFLTTTIHTKAQRIIDYESSCYTFANIDNFIPGEVYNVGGNWGKWTLRIF